MKKDFLKDSLGWKDDGVTSSFECFLSAFPFYTNNMTPSKIPALFDDDNIGAGFKDDYKSCLIRIPLITHIYIFGAKTEAEYVRYVP
jgi:hypothetical protein